MVFTVDTLLHYNSPRHHGIEMALFSTGFLYISIMFRIENDPNS